MNYPDDDYPVRDDDGERLESINPDVDNQLYVAVTQAVRSAEDGHTRLYYEIISEAEKTMIAEVMQRFRFNQSKASVFLGINRGTLRAKLKNYGLL